VDHLSAPHDTQSAAEIKQVWDAARQLPLQDAGLAAFTGGIVLTQRRGNMRKTAIMFGLVAGLVVAAPTAAQQVTTKKTETHTTTITPKVPTVSVTTHTTTTVKHRPRKVHRKRHVAKKTGTVTTTTYKHTEKKVGPQ
jgi:hypothetical protein